MIPPLCEQWMGALLNMFDRSEVQAALDALAPNPWMTKPAEFPLEAAERADADLAEVPLENRDDWLLVRLDDAATIRTDRAEEGP